MTTPLSHSSKPGKPGLFSGPLFASPAARSFWIALLCAGAIFLPFVIYDRGFFIYYGDFNVQQIPFYMLAHDAVRSGNLLWNWHTDLGANFIGSYSFYLLFSPFFWLTLPFPNHLLPHLMAPLLVLKTACASLTAFLYLRRFVRDQRYAVAGSLLYAFSGWMTFNIFFNHFHEVAVFFPLLLLSLEELVQEDRKCFFALMVALNAMVNYWFFIGEVVFILLYVIVRGCYHRSWSLTPAKFFRIALESVLGVALAAFALLPSALAILGNPRTGTDSLLSGWNFWIYWNDQRLFAVLQSFFFPPEQPARPNFFPDMGAKWSSLSAWLPLLGPVGVMAYFSQWKRDWLKTMLGISILFALIPGLGSLFVLLNNSYYARWFYMPLLLMALASVRAIEHISRRGEEFRTAMKWQLLITTVFTLAVCLTPEKKDGNWRIGLAELTWQAWLWYGVVVICLVLTFLLLFKLRKDPAFHRIFAAGICLVAVCFTVPYMFGGKNNYERSRFMVEKAIGGIGEISLPEGPFARSDGAKTTDNLLMFWKLPNIQTFHSIVPVSIMEFYPEVGVKRDVGSRPETDYYALRSLLSVRWLFYEEKNYDEPPMPGYTFYDVQNDFQIYENDCFLPMGFTYDHLIRQSELPGVAATKRGNLLLRAMVLEEEGIQRNEDLLTYLPEKEMTGFEEESYFRDVEARRQFTATGFYHDRSGFGAETDFPAEKLLFFSVPFDKGWSATVNGEPALIEKANVGFMAVRVPAGKAVVRFDYMTPGLIEGSLISGAALLILLPYLLFARRRKLREERKRLLENQREYATGVRRLSWDEYLAEFDPARREELLREAFLQAERLGIEKALPQVQRTLKFSLPDLPLDPDSVISPETGYTDDNG